MERKAAGEQEAFYCLLRACLQIRKHCVGGGGEFDLHVNVCRLRNPTRAYEWKAGKRLIWHCLFGRGVLAGRLDSFRCCPVQMFGLLTGIADTVNLPSFPSDASQLL